MGCLAWHVLLAPGRAAVVWGARTALPPLQVPSPQAALPVEWVLPAALQCGQLAGSRVSWGTSTSWGRASCGGRGHPRAARHCKATTPGWPALRCGWPQGQSRRRAGGQGNGREASTCRACSGVVIGGRSRRPPWHRVRRGATKMDGEGLVSIESHDGTNESSATSATSGDAGGSGASCRAREERPIHPHRQDGLIGRGRAVGADSVAWTQVANREQVW